MTVEQRIKISILIQKMNEQKTYSEKLGLENISKFREEKVRKERDVKC